MAEDFPPPSESGNPLDVEHAQAERDHQKKHKNKVRAAWISFIGRIIAQIAGAAATIVIGLAVLSHYGSRSADQRESPAAAANGIAAQPRRIDSSPDEIDLAVLPLESLSADPAQGYLADGITESLILHLSRIERLHVISRASSMHFKGLSRPVPQVASELGVDLLIEGTVASDGGRVRVTVRLVDAIADHGLWAQSYERPAGTILAMQADVSAAIAREVNVAVAPAIERALARQPRIDPAVYEEYLRGRVATRVGTAESRQAGIRHFEQAIRLGPGFAPAHGGLATTFALAGITLHRGEDAAQTDLAHARAAATGALALDSSLAEAHAALALVSHRLDWDWIASEAAFRRALALGPGDALAHQWYAVLLSEQGRHREAVAEAAFAVELDPLLADAHGTLGLVHYYNRRFDRAAAASRRALELEPSLADARLILARSLLEQGDAAGAIAVCEERPWRLGLDEMLATLFDANRRLGRTRRADEIRRELLALDSASPAALVRLHISRNEIREAFDLLERGVTARSALVRAMKVDPVFARLRRDPRFVALIARLKLEDGQ